MKNTKPKLSIGQIFKLLWETYRLTFPYALMFIVALILAVVFINEVLLR
ncbi:MAG: hypothetical protein R2880_16475 [Deinococcales bacterium]